MGVCRSAMLAALLALFPVCALGVDYAVDPTFNPTFQFPDFSLERSISDIVVQPDGKLLVGGTFRQVNGVPSMYIVRLNSDGSVDPTFNSGLNVYVTGYVRTIKSLANGKLFVTGRFYVGTQFTSYARLNSDGSVDQGLQLAPVSDVIEPLPDGRFLVCGGRWINEQTYWVAHRLNADGSADPTYRVTYSAGSCNDMRVLPDGKVLMAGGFHDNNGYYYKPLHRFNPDGSKDLSFDLEVPEQSYGPAFEVLPDGKFLLSYSNGSTTYVKRFNSNGSVDISYPNCFSEAFLPIGDGNVLMNGCRKWPTGLQYQFANVRSDATLEPSLDWLDFDGRVTGFRAGADGKYYAFGLFTKVGNIPRLRLVRLMPQVNPSKPKFDFDGDGKSDYAVFRPSDGYWYMYRSTAGIQQFPWGLPTDAVIAGDYDWDGKTDAGVFRNGLFHAYGGVWGYTWVEIGYSPGTPRTGDFDNDGKDDWVVRRINGGAASWEHRRAGVTPVASPDLRSIEGELGGDKPLIGDFDGDSRDELAVFRDGLWLSRDIGSGAPTASFQWGTAGDIPVPEDYDGDGQTDYAVFRPATGVWWINRSNEGVIGAAWGMSGDVPVPADYDGDGRADIAIFRDGQWWQFLSGTETVSVANWGTSGDIPVQSQQQRN